MAQHYALAYPEKLSHLILVCTAASHYFIEEGVARVRRIVGPEVWRTLDAMSHQAPSVANMIRSFELQVGVFFRDPANAAAIDLGRVRWGLASLAAWAHIARFDLWPRLVGLRVPTLVIAGKYDRGIPVHFSEELARPIPGARLAVSDNAGHLPFIEDPEWFQRTVREFVLGPQST